jgi:hypothetical protein
VLPSPPGGLPVPAKAGLVAQGHLFRTHAGSP